MKKSNILISLLAVACLVGCSGNNNNPSGGNSNSNGGESSAPADSSNSGGNENKAKITIADYGTAKFEAEEFDSSDWDYESDDAVVVSSKASGGKYLSAAIPDSTGTCTFYFELAKHSKVVFAAAFAQTEDWLESDFEMDKTYIFGVENVNNFNLPSGKNVLPARASAENWQLMEYNPEVLYPGEYKVTLSVAPDTPKGCPSIDYVQFKTSDPNEVIIDPSTITEDDIPDNDMRNLQQYKYVVEKDVLKYKTYATGADLSAPRGMKLKYDDVETASKYYVQVAESEAALSSAAVRESSNKYYFFQNAKLATKYYYRAATSEAGLASAKVYDITSTAQAPRVVYVPDVLNFRDIGGWDSELVPGAKINQGLYFRCAQLNGAAGSTTSKLDSAGKGLAALKELGIKCDIDMRDIGNQPNRGQGPSPANTTDWPFTFVSAAVPSGSEPVRWEGGSYQGTNIAEQYVKIFDALAKCDQEPALLHCTYGADRTGIVTFFLESLLGMSQEDMTKDYLWTQFTQGRNVKILESEGAEFPQWISKTEACEGSTFADKMENHLESFGIEHAKLEHIREIFVPGYVAK